MNRKNKILSAILMVFLVMGGMAFGQANTAKVTPIDACALCEARLEGALSALAEANEENARLTERLRKCRKRFKRCKNALEECRAELEECQGGACCDPSEEPGTNGNPFCFEGATCCADGIWRCNNGDGSPSCLGSVGEVCEACCDPSEEPGTNGNPICFEGATCCANGTWACNRGDGSPTCDAGQVCTEDPCVDPSTGTLICCIVDGERIPIGDTFPAGDGCNVCTCLPSGQIVCTLRPCSADPCRDPATGRAICCLVDGERIPIGDTFPADDGCNVCTCLPSGQMICTLRPCPDPSS